MGEYRDPGLVPIEHAQNLRKWNVQIASEFYFDNKRIISQMCGPNTITMATCDMSTWELLGLFCAGICEYILKAAQISTEIRIFVNVLRPCRERPESITDN